MDVPELGVLDDQSTFLAGSLSDLGGAVVQLHGHVVAAVGGDGVIDLGAVRSQAVLDGIVQNALGGQGHQLDGAMDAGIVVEVEVGAATFLPLDRVAVLPAGSMYSFSSLFSRTLSLLYWL